MTFTMTIWALSLVVMLVLVALGRRSSRSFDYAQVPQDLGEFVRDTLYRSADRFSHVIHRVKPHASRVAGVFIIIGKKGHDTFIDRVFGKTNAEKGRASSFFLKNIAEHKAESRRDGDAKNGY